MSRSLKFAVLGLTVMAAGCDRQGSGEAQPAASASATASPDEPTSGEAGIDRSRKGSAMPDMTFTDTSGKKLTLASLKGKPVLINLWATWCAPCVAELPQLDKLAAGGLRVVTVSQDMETEKVGGFLKERGVTRLEPWLDPDNTLSTQYSVNTLPATIMYDASGREVWRFTGPRDWLDKESTVLIAEAGR